MLRPNELLQSRSRLTIQDQRLSFDVYPDVLLHILDQAVKPLQKHGSTLHAALEMLLDVGCVKRRSLGKQGLIGRLNGEKGLSNLALTSTASRLFPFIRLSRGFHKSGLQNSLQLNCAMERPSVIRPMIGALPDLSRLLFLR